MSETDSFIQEVTEEVRQDRMFALWKKYAPYVVGAVVLIVGAAAAWSWWQASEREAAEARGTLLIEVDDRDPAAVVELSNQLDGPAKLIAEMRAAAALVAAGNEADAAATYADIASREGVAPEYRDLATLQAVRLGAEGIDADREIGRIADGEGPYRLLAREMRASRAIAAGEIEQGHAELNEIVRDPSVTPWLQQRAVALLIATGGKVELPETGEG